MTTTLADLFDRTLFDAMVRDGYVRVQTHPTLPLCIANYAEKAQFENVWNAVTLTCRGLIYAQDDETVLARPYRKFFNYGDDANTGPLDLSAAAVVTDKLDGSLGISYPTPNSGLAVATRGSFASDQAQHATKLLQARYSDFVGEPGLTYLWEIVYRDNRIVVDYGDTDDLFLHGVVDQATGDVHPVSAERNYGWPGPLVQTFAYDTLGAALAADDRRGVEGLVVLLSDQRMVKLKQADYVALHRIITGLNAKTVWEWIGDGKTVGDLCVTVPDEFHGWIETVAGELEAAAAELINVSVVEHDQIMAGLDVDHERGDYARRAAQSRYRSFLFMLYDGQQERARELAWRSVKPSGARSMVNHSEAVA